MLEFFKNLSPTEAVAIALILIVFFGAKTVKNLGKVSGETMREVKKFKKSFTDAVEDDSDNDEKEVSK